MHPVPTETWRRKSDLVSYDLVLDPADISLREATIAVLDALGDFADARPVRLTTMALGDGAEEVAPVASALRAAFERHQDVVMVETGLDLRLDVGGGEGRIENGADLWVELDDEDEPDGALRVRLSLDVDVYATQTRGDVTDNAALGRANAPRLVGFLRRLRAQAWQVREVAASAYLREEAQRWLGDDAPSQTEAHR